MVGEATAEGSRLWAFGHEGFREADVEPGVLIRRLGWMFVAPACSSISAEGALTSLWMASSVGPHAQSMWRTGMPHASTTSGLSVQRFCELGSISPNPFSVIAHGPRSVKRCLSARPMRGVPTRACRSWLARRNLRTSQRFGDFVASTYAGTTTYSANEVDAGTGCLSSMRWGANVRGFPGETR